MTNLLFRITATALAFSMGAVGAHADRLTEAQKIQLHQHEQCANVCQVKLDTESFACMKAHEQDKRAGRKITPVDCEEKATERYRTCSQACPVNPRENLR